jgi:hypothetical protein
MHQPALHTDVQGRRTPVNNLICNSALVVATALLTACATSTPQPQPVTGASAPPPPAAYAPPPTAVRSGAAPNALVASLNDAPSNGTAQPIDPLLAGAAGSILDKVAGNLAAGMSRDGSPMAATFQPGQTMEQAVQLQTGRCYTVVAAGPNVQAWDFSLVLATNPLPVTAVLAHETASGTTASLGGNGNCMRWNFLPAQAHVVVKVTQGSGVAVAQLYGK